MAADHVGAVAVGSKTGGKSQALNFMEQFCQSSQGEQDKGVRFQDPVQDKGKVSPPQSDQELFRMFNEHVFANGVVEACSHLRPAALKHHGVTCPEDPNEILQLCTRHFDKRKKAPISKKKATRVRTW
jgi:hypothetical protein